MEEVREVEKWLGLAPASREVVRSQGSSPQQEGFADSANGPSMEELTAGYMDMMGNNPDQAPLSIKEARRMRKSKETEVSSIENRIKFFKREEEKIWRDLEDVRRQAAKIEDGRSRTLEKKLADKAISQVREELKEDNRNRVRCQKQVATENKTQKAHESQVQRRMASDQQRKERQDILRKKRLEKDSVQLQKSEKVLSIQRDQLEAKMKSNRMQTERLAALRNEQEVGRIEAVNTVQQVESRLPELEAEEMACLQRLKNSRIITETVLEELEASLGPDCVVATLMRSKAHQRAAGVNAVVRGYPPGEGPFAFDGGSSATMLSPLQEGFSDGAHQGSSPLQEGFSDGADQRRLV